MEYVKETTVSDYHNLFLKRDVLLLAESLKKNLIHAHM